MKIKKWGIYWVDLTNVNDFSKGSRPCLIISSNDVNNGSDCVTFIPLKSFDSKRHRVFKNNDMVFKMISNKNEPKSYLSVNNIYTINKKKVDSYKGYMSLKDTKKVKKLIKNSILKG